MKAASLALGAALAASASAQATDPQAPESICVFDVRPFTEGELAFLSGEALDSQTKKASLAVCRRRLMAEMKSLRSDIELHREIGPQSLRRYAAVKRLVPPDDRDRGFLEDKIVRALIEHFTPRIPDIDAGKPYTGLENGWLSALPPPRKEETLREARRLSAAPPSEGAPPPQSAATGAVPHRVAQCEPEMCGAYRENGCKPPPARVLKLLCKNLNQEMRERGCVCPPSGAP